MTAPHLDAQPVTRRRGHLFLPGELLQTQQGMVQSGPCHVEWEAPGADARPLPVVLVHGGGGQGTDWKATPDGRPGWLDHLVDAGYAVYNVDRPGHGRSGLHPTLRGQMTPPQTYAFATSLWAPTPLASAQTQWLWGREPGDPALDRLVASSGAASLDQAASQALDARRLTQLLDLIGPAILITHSAGSPAGWLTADARPELVASIVAVEPMGPPFARTPAFGAMEWGLSHAKASFDPPVQDPAELHDGTRRRSRGLDGIPVAVVSGGASCIGSHAPAVVQFLRGVGAHADRLHLPDLGIEGNGHGLMFEANSAETIRPVLEWLDTSVAQVV